MHIFLLLCARVVGGCPYRLSDIVKGVKDAGACACVSSNQSVACEYIRNTAKNGDILTLAAIIKSRVELAPWLRATPNVTHVHVRAGDGITGPDWFS